jgi:hypothetical protein
VLLPFNSVEIVDCEIPTAFAGFRWLNPSDLINSRNTSAGDSAAILRVESSLWMFARVADAPAKDNAAERAEQNAVIWRRISRGTDIKSESRSVKRKLMVVACRQQVCNDPVDLSTCFRAARNSQVIPVRLRVGRSRGNPSRLIPAMPPGDLVL